MRLVSTSLHLLSFWTMLHPIWANTISIYSTSSIWLLCSQQLLIKPREMTTSCDCIRSAMRILQLFLIISCLFLPKFSYCQVAVDTVSIPVSDHRTAKAVSAHSTTEGPIPTYSEESVQVRSSNPVVVKVGISSSNSLKRNVDSVRIILLRALLAVERRRLGFTFKTLLSDTVKCSKPPGQCYVRFKLSGRRARVKTVVFKSVINGSLTKLKSVNGFKKLFGAVKVRKTELSNIYNVDLYFRPRYLRQVKFIY